jgi:hypothetical protein
LARTGGGWGRCALLALSFGHRHARQELIGRSVGGGQWLRGLDHTRSRSEPVVQTTRTILSWYLAPSDAVPRPSTLGIGVVADRSPTLM